MGHPAESMLVETVRLSIGVVIQVESPSVSCSHSSQKHTTSGAHAPLTTRIA